MRLRLSQVSSRMLLILGVLIAAVLVAPGASAQEGEGIQGTFINRDDGKKPVPGVVVVVSDASGTKVGTATSDADGSYSLDLPKPERT